MKLNLVIDASGIFYRSLFTVGNYGTKKGQRLLESDDSKGVFMRKLATDFAALVKSVESVNRVIVCLDSQSWRKKIQIDGGGYKISRKKDESTIDWNSFYEITNEFVEIIQNKGYIISKVKEAEADDLLFLWSRRLNNMGESVVLVTGDRDLHQCIQQHKNGTFTVVLDPVSQRRRIILTQETFDARNTSAEEYDIFNPDSWNSGVGDILEMLLSKNDNIIINPEDIATKKVILGDAGDSVPGLISWIDKKDVTKTRSMTENKLQKVLSTLSHVSWKNLQNGEMTELFTESVNRVMKMTLRKEDVQAKIDRNVQLVVLTTEIIPADIQKNFEILSADITNSPVNMPRELILEGTKWWNEKKTFVPTAYEIKIDGAEEEFENLGKPVTSGIKIKRGIEGKNTTSLF